MFLCVTVLLLSALQCSRGSYSDSWAVQIHGGEEEAARLAIKHGFINRGKIGNLPDHYHFVLREWGGRGEGQQQPERTHALLSESQVGYAEQQVIKRHVHRDYIVPTDPKWSTQWSLKNPGTLLGPAGLDLNVEPAWLQGITGRGVVVALVDDGLEQMHPDLKDNFAADVSYDFVEEDHDPTPDYSGNNSHGTSCAGEVAMAKNGICGIGVAYQSSIAGLKVKLDNSHDLIEARALGFQSNSADIYSNSWGPSDNGFLVDGPGKLVEQTLSNAVKNGRGGKGSIYVWAAGNGGDNYDSCAADGYSSSIYTIAVGSADQTGAQAYYDEQCSGKMAVTFSYNNLERDRQISTTTVHGECIDTFTGTSASAPLMSGVVALTLQANPELTWRDVQYLIVYTSNPELLTGGEWTTNGAGLNVSHKFGFGAVDAEAMVTRARSWTTVPPQLEFSLPSNNSGNASIVADYSTNFSVASSDIKFLEHVVLQVTLQLADYGKAYNLSALFNATSDDEFYNILEDPHPRRGDIKLQLVSPAGTHSTLLPYRNFDFVNVEGYYNWPFMSVHFWGEDPNGTWTASVSFNSSAGWVSVRDAVLVLYGVASTPASVEEGTHCDAATCARGCSAAHCDVCRAYRNSSSLDCVDTCSSSTTTGYTLYNGYCVRGEVVFPPKSVSIGLVFGVVCAVVVLLCAVCLPGAVIAALLIRRKKKRRTQGYQLAFEADDFDEEM